MQEHGPAPNWHGERIAIDDEWELALTTRAEMADPSWLIIRITPTRDHLTRALDFAAFAGNDGF
jgi:hypothetical protein